MEEPELTCVFTARKIDFYQITVQGYIEPHDEVASVMVVDDEGRIISRTTYNANSGMFNAATSVMLRGFDGETRLSVVLENANWILTSVVQPFLNVTKVG
jgi:hypothetical protein